MKTEIQMRKNYRDYGLGFTSYPTLCIYQGYTEVIYHGAFCHKHGIKFIKFMADNFQASIIGSD